MKGRDRKMKLISWNVNGIRACVNKGFKEFFFKEIDADILYSRNKMSTRTNRVRI